MGLGEILIYLLLLVSLIVFIYVLVITARGWGVLHSILLSLLFIECWVFIVFSAGVQYRRVNATKAAFENRNEAVKALAETQRLLYGDFGVKDDDSAVVPVKGKLRRLTVDRGRVWRQVELLESKPASYRLELSAADVGKPADEADAFLDEADAPAAATKPLTSESLPVGTVVYGFAEELDEEGRPMPVYYLGEFSVTNSQDGEVSLRPTLPLYDDQQRQISSGSASTWTLYELMPLDGHEMFVAEDSVPDEEYVYGRTDKEAIEKLLADVPSENERQEQLISSFLRDGTKANENDRPENVWIKAEVVKEYKIDIDSKEVANATERGFFDSFGRSIDARLKVGDRNEEGGITLAPGKTILLREVDAQPLIQNGTLRLVERVFVRQLNDYEEAFNQHFVRDHDVSENIKLVQRDSDEIRKANQLGQEMINFRQVENEALQSDLANYAKEQAALEEAVAQGEAQYAGLKSRLSQLYRTVQASRP